MGPEELDQDQLALQALGVEAFAELVDCLEWWQGVAHGNRARGHALFADGHGERKKNADENREDSGDPAIPASTPHESAEAQKNRHTPAGYK